MSAKVHRLVVGGLIAEMYLAAMMTAAPAESALEILVRDFEAYHAQCDKAAQSDTAHFKQCSEEKAGLVARQKELHLSDAELQGLLTPLGKTRGGIRGVY